MDTTRTRRAAYWVASEFLLLVVAAVFPALLVFHAARLLDVAAKRRLLGALDPYPRFRDLLEWSASGELMKTTRILSLLLLLLVGLPLAAQFFPFPGPGRAPVSTTPAGDFNGSSSKMSG